MTTATPTTAAALETDVAVIGAGPVGLFAVFELGLLECSAHLIDALPRVGGQPVELYGDKPLYDIPGIPMCTGQQLVDGLLRQIEPFNTPMHLGQRVDTLQRQPDGRWLVGTQHGLRLLAKAVFIAAGLGAFEPRRLKLDGLDALEGRDLFYTLPDAARLSGQQVVVVGGEDAALQTAIDLATRAHARPARIALLHRRDAFQAAPATVDRLQALRAAGALRFVVGQVQGFDRDAGGRLNALQVMGPDGATAPLAADALLVCQGFSPRLGPIVDWQLAMERKQLVVDTEKFQTSEPGIFAIGDINTYPGKKKLILSGFHEATLAAYAAQTLIAPDSDLPFQYTTSSTRVHRLLGVGPAHDD